MRTVDISGQRFSAWTVLDRSDRPTVGGVYWRCRCDCGNERDVMSGTLRYGKSTNCGCLANDRRAEAQMGKPKTTRRPLVGQRFGRLEVIEDSWQDGAGFCRVRCDCGTEKRVRRGQLVSADTLSCGCMQRETAGRAAIAAGLANRLDLTGRRFGKLEAVHLADGRRHGGMLWHVRCDCGTEKVCARADLVSGTTTSCGCRPKLPKYANTRAYRKALLGNLYERMDARLRHCLRSRGIEHPDVSWPNILYYTVEELKDHLEKTMPDGFGWEDIRAMHIDHHRPLASFVFTSADDDAFLDAWALSNLKLLPGPENCRKGARWDTLAA